MNMYLHRVVQRWLCTYTKWCRDDSVLIQGGAEMNMYLCKVVQRWLDIYTGWCWDDYVLIESGADMITYLCKVVQRWLDICTGWCWDDYPLIQSGTETIKYVYRVVQRWYAFCDVFCTTRKRRIIINKYYVLTKKLNFDFNFSLIVNVVLLPLGDHSVPELYVSTFRNTFSVPS